LAIDLQIDEYCSKSERMIEQLAQEWDTDTAQLIAWADRLTPAQLAQRPAADKWSVLEVFEHMFVVEKGAARLLGAPAEPTERDLEKSRRRMARGLSDLNVKYAGGSQIDPRGRFQSYAEWRAAFIANREAMLHSAQELGLDGLCAGFPHPYFGHLTRAEWIIFSMLHGQRHHAQLVAMLGQATAEG
jgi:uncharacterized damage-inducible protein DinB